MTKTMAWILAALAAVAACEKSGKSDKGGAGSGSNPADEVLAKMQSTRDAACACTDKACTDRVHDDFKKWLAGNAGRLQRAGMPAQEFQEKFTRLGSEAQRCIQRYESPPTIADPSAPPPSSEPAPTTPAPEAAPQPPTPPPGP